MCPLHSLSAKLYADMLVGAWVADSHLGKACVHHALLADYIHWDDDHLRQEGRDSSRDCVSRHVQVLVSQDPKSVVHFEQIRSDDFIACNIELARDHAKCGDAKALVKRCHAFVPHYFAKRVKSTGVLHHVMATIDACDVTLHLQSSFHERERVQRRSNQKEE
jgi:hypothetical protein